MAERVETAIRKEVKALCAEAGVEKPRFVVVSSNEVRAILKHKGRSQALYFERFSNSGRAVRDATKEARAILTQIGAFRSQISSRPGYPTKPGTLGAVMQDAIDGTSSASPPAINGGLNGSASGGGGEHHADPNDDGAKQKQKLRYVDIAAITKLLWRDGKINKTTGVYTYDEGKSDETIRNEVGTHIRLDLLATLRKETFGPLAQEVAAKGKRGRPKGVTQLSLIMAKQQEIDERLAFLENALGVEHK